jgi:hypothetical protein
MASKHAWVGLGAIVLLFGCGGLGNVGAVPPRAPSAPGPYISQDIAAGYAAYKDTLSRWGTWAPDGRYGVHWCPASPDPMAASESGQTETVATEQHPYVSDGHWAPAPNDPNKGPPAYGAAPGTPYWVSDDREAWGEITMHHGWWVHFDSRQDGVAHEWCWVPGADPTPARVVWRSGAGFVGWAPEPPACTSDDDSDAESQLEEDLSWSFELLAGLFEKLVDSQLLYGDARSDAAAATTPDWSPHAPASIGRFGRVGPGVHQVGDARRAVAVYAETHAAALHAAGGVARSSAGGANGSASAGSMARANGSSASAATPAGSTAAANKNDTKKEKELDDALPPGMLLYEAMLHEPLVGPIGTVPRAMGAFELVPGSPGEGSSASAVMPGGSAGPSARGAGGGALGSAHGRGNANGVGTAGSGVHGAGTTSPSGYSTASSSSGSGHASSSGGGRGHSSSSSSSSSSNASSSSSSSHHH